MEKNGKQAAGGNLLLISDGGENLRPRINDVKPSVIKKGITVDTIQYGIEAEEKLKTLAAETGGIAFYFSGSEDSTTLKDAFTTTVTLRDGCDTSRAVQIESRSISIRKNFQHVGHVYLDSSIGKKTDFTFTIDKYDRSNDDFSVTILTPKAKEISLSNSSLNINNDLKTITVRVPRLADVSVTNCVCTIAHRLNLF